MENLVTKVQKLVVVALAVLLLVVVVLSTAHLGVLVVEEIWKPPRFLIPVQGLLDIFGFFLLVLIGVELLDTVKTYFKKDVIHVRVVLEVALIAMTRGDISWTIFLYSSISSGSESLCPDASSCLMCGLLATRDGWVVCPSTNPSNSLMRRVS